MADAFDNHRGHGQIASHLATARPHYAATSETFSISVKIQRWEDGMGRFFIDYCDARGRITVWKRRPRAATASLATTAAARLWHADYTGAGTSGDCRR